MRRFDTCFLGIFILLFALFAGKADVRAAEEITTYISVERFTLGQGYILTPRKVTVEKGTKASRVVEMVLEEEGLHPETELNSSYGWYLIGIYGTDIGKTRVPVSVMGLSPGIFSGDYRTGILPPSENYVYPELAEFSYQMEGENITGWFYYINNIDPGYSMGNYELKDQDVIRLQFTLIMGDLAKVPDIDEATRALAIMKDYLRVSSDTEIFVIYSDSLAVFSDMDAEKEDILRAQDLLTEISEDLEDGSKDRSYADCQIEMREIYDKTKAHDVELRIGLLPERITLEDRILVEDIQALFDALSADQKTLISSEDKEILSAASETIEVLEEEARKAKEEADKKAEEEAARKAKEKAEAEAAKARAKQEADQKAAAAVVAKINAIGSVTLAKESLIKGARAAYKALNADASKMVPSAALSKLTSSEKKLAALKKAQALKKKYTPAKAKISKIRPGKKKVKLTWKKISKATGYQIFMSAKKKSGYKKIATIKKAKTVTFTRKKLKSKKVYYFKIRAYRKAGKKTYYGAYSTVKKAKVK